MNTARSMRRRILLAAVVLFLAAGLSPRGQAALPSGFSEQIVVGGFNLPVAFEMLPDGRILIAEKSGLVRLVKNGSLQPVPFVDLRTRVNDYWDRGLLGMTSDPDFATNGYVYFFYVRENDAADYDGPKTSRLTRVTAVGDTASLASEIVLVGALGGAGCAGLPAGADCIPADNSSHNGGGLRAAPDRTLYLSIGDASNFNIVDPVALRAQNLDSLAGKLLRVDPLGNGLPTNPYWNGNPTAARSRVLAYGFRNPFRLSLHPTRDTVFVGDVGWEDWEEIDAVTLAGGNYGWPCYEGLNPQSGYAALAQCQALYASGPDAVVAPLHAASHTGVSASITAGDFATGGHYPAAYDGAFFFADYAQGTISYLKVDENDALSGPVLEFATEAGAPVDLHFGPDGDLYYLDIIAGEIRRLSWVPGGPSTQYVSALSWEVVTNGWGAPERDRSNGELAADDGQPIVLKGESYARGAGVHAPSEIRFLIAGNCTTFRSDIGVDDETGGEGSVVFQVWADGVKLYDSGVVTGETSTLGITVDVAGRQELVLVVTDAGDGPSFDHADWADAVLECTVAPAGLFAAAVSLGAGGNTHSVALVDLDLDGRLDLVAANALDSTASVWRGNGDATFGTRADFSTGAPGQTPKHIAIGDLNGDTIPDLVAANQDAGTVSVLLGAGGAGFGLPVAYPACTSAHESALGDFNQDGDLDLIVACWGGSVVSVLIGRGDGTFNPAVLYPSGANPHSVVVGDFNGDAVLDAAIANRGSSDVSILLGLGTGAFAPQVRYPVGANPHSIRTGDLNGDGTIDLATANEGAASVTVLRGLGDGTFAAAVHHPTGDTPKGVAVADVDGDGFEDILTANTAGSYPTCCNPGGNTMSVLLGTGGGAFAAMNLYTVGLTPFAIALGDVDGDGDLDAATANWHSDDVALLMNLSASAPGGPPQISGVAAAGITTTGATITWTTDEPADGQVEYGPSTGYGSLTPLQAGLMTLHSAPVTGLSPGTLYHYRVRSRDADANLTVSGDHSFTTTSSGGTGTTTYLSNLTWLSMTNGWGAVERDRSNGEAGAADGAPLRVNGVVYAKGLGTHALSDLRYAIPAGCTEFRATAGVDDEVGANGSVTFTVWGDAVSLFSSATLTGASAPVNVVVALGGRSELRLVVGNGGNDINYDHADWADARFLCDGSDPPPPPPPPPPPDTTTRYLSDLAWLAMTNGWGPVERDRSNGEAGAADGAPLTMNGLVYAKGLGTHALSDLRVAIPAGCTEFRTTVGVDDEVGANGTVTFTVWGDAVSLFSSATLTGNSVPVNVVVPLGGRSELRLVVGNGGNDINYDHADWADARFLCGSAPPPSNVQYLSDVSWLFMTNGWGPVEPDRSNGEAGVADGAALRVNGVVYAKGLGTHALSELRYAIPAGCTEFRATAGLDDEVGTNGSVTFTVWGDAVSLFSSATVTGTSAPVDIAVLLSGHSELRLVVGNGGDNINYDHADWADARFLCGSPANAAPTATITEPAAGFQYTVGDVVTFAGTAQDPEDGNLTGASLTWSVILYHCPGGDCHAHPFVNGSGSSGSFTVPDHGDDNFFEIVLTATDSGGLSDIRSVTIQPQTVEITLDTMPTGLQVSYGGVTGTAPMIRTSVVGSTHTIGVLSPQGAVVFQSWSDGGAQQHNIVTGSSPAVYVATFGSTP